MNGAHAWKLKDSPIVEDGPSWIESFTTPLRLLSKSSASSSSGLCIALCVIIYPNTLKLTPVLCRSLALSSVGGPSRPFVMRVFFFVRSCFLTVWWQLLFLHQSVAVGIPALEIPVAQMFRPECGLLEINLFAGLFRKLIIWGIPDDGEIIIWNPLAFLPIQYFVIYFESAGKVIILCHFIISSMELCAPFLPTNPSFLHN